ncbi:MAG: two-component system, chemotaxis family, protein-glutamate methylesterase/glutaminase [Frankiales bacterium]|jgi:two-component system, chemotaxis family, protein-glutamate methylesterase/glutaminase|nr:two-component system, chemotaxis family, protein-glutamate methylesterase/glutaminase [Frankiales bacterium]MDX6211187.1 two-component system, chemotaxis family, protein-glutamate methylesterase/glutaminase [Frankiales bacterium]
MPHLASIKVLVVDDSVVVRRLVTTALSSDPDIEVVGTASSGRLALDKILQLNPDLVTLDIEMPDMDGLETLKELRRRHPKLPVVMFSSLTERGAAITLDALTFGANDYVCKPTRVSSPDEAMANVREQLIPKIKALTIGRSGPAEAVRPATMASASLVRPRVAVPSTGAEPTGPVDVIAIGASTGGPDALASILAQLPADFPVPVVIVQHMPPLFTRLFAQRLNTASQVTVREARDGDLVEPGTVLIAPGDFHLSLRREGLTVRAVTHQEGPENWVRPAVDVLFRSVAEVYGERALGVVLTGMGQDGIRGVEKMVEAGAQIVVQNEATSVVWGMPGVVAAAGLAHRILPLTDVAPHVMAVAGRTRSLASVRAALGVGR